MSTFSKKPDYTIDIDGAGVAGPRFKRLKVAISRCCLLGNYWDKDSNPSSRTDIMQNIHTAVDS